MVCGFYDPKTQPKRANWKEEHIELIRNGKLVSFALYDLIEDPQQQNDLSKKEVARFKELKASLEKAHAQYQREAVGWKGVTPQYP